MQELKIRLFRPDDVPALIRLAQVSFADEFTAQGLTPEAFVQQLRRLTWGRMIPFKVLTALSRITWELFVAEQAGQVVGCAAYAGRKRMLLSTLMVDPGHRRQGIGQALLVRRLERIQERGYPSVVVTVLATNAASLGNLAKQNFQELERYALYEHALPLVGVDLAQDKELTARPLVAADRMGLAALEQQLNAPAMRAVRDSVIPSYMRSLVGRLFDRMTRTHWWNRAFEHQGRTIGYLSARTSAGQTTGEIDRLLLPEEAITLAPAMIEEAARWLHQHGKTAVQVVVPEQHGELATYLEQAGWRRVLTWIDLVKWLDPDAQKALVVAAPTAE